MHVQVLLSPAPTECEVREVFGLFLPFWQDKDAVLELERLRQEVSWYRLELVNREGNFNRMFAPHLPVNVATPGSAAVSGVCVCVC